MTHIGQRMFLVQLSSGQNDKYPAILTVSFTKLWQRPHGTMCKEPEAGRAMAHEVSRCWLSLPEHTAGTGYRAGVLSLVLLTRISGAQCSYYTSCYWHPTRPDSGLRTPEQCSSRDVIQWSLSSKLQLERMAWMASHPIRHFSLVSIIWLTGLIPWAHLFSKPAFSS